MRAEGQLLASIKHTRVERTRLLTLQDKSQLIKLIESLGHFKLVDEDIAWLEERLNSQKGANQ